MKEDRIRSEARDFELLFLSAENQIYKCFELIGIFEEYSPENANLTFEKWYLQCEQRKLYRFRNKGVVVIYKLLEDSYQGYDGHFYHISKRSMRQYGRTTRGSRVIVYEGTYIVLQKMLSYIKSNALLWSVYLKYIHRSDAIQFLSFQQECMIKYVGAGITRRKKYYTEQVKNKLENLITTYSLRG